MDLSALKSLDLDQLDKIDVAELTQPWEAYSEEVYGSVEQSDAAIRTAIASSRCIDAEATLSAADAIGTLPEPTEAIHMRIGWRHSMGDVIPAVLKLSGGTIEELHVATLTFSKVNSIDWSALLDQKKIGSLTVVCSQYFQKTSPHIYDPAAAMFSTRAVRMIPIRSHCKILLFRLSDGRLITVTGSSNTRSAKTTEQMEMFADPKAYHFHHDWFMKVIASRQPKITV